MIIGLYTSEHYFDQKKVAVEEAVKKLGTITDTTIVKAFRPPLSEQTFGFEDMFKRAKACSEAAMNLEGAEIGIGIENSLAFIYNTNEWYYVIGISMQSKDGQRAESFTPGIKVPQWMMQDIQKNNRKIDSLTQELAGEDDPVIYFSGGTLTRKDIMVPTLLLAFANLNLKKAPAGPPSPPAPPSPH